MPTIEPSELISSRPKAIEITPEIAALARHYGTKFSCSPEIHEFDYLLGFLVTVCGAEGAISNYFEEGRKNADQVKRLVTRLRLPKTCRILEFASGYGRISRHLTSLRMTCSDIHPEAMEFIKRRIGLTAIPSAHDPRDLSIQERYDLIFVASLFSHLPDHMFGPWLSKLCSMLKPGGYLMFTVQGETSAVKHAHMEKVLEREKGWGFSQESEQRDIDTSAYGTMVTTADYVTGKIREHTGCQIISFLPAEWWDLQDEWVIQRPASGTVRKIIKAFIDRLRGATRPSPTRQMFRSIQALRGIAAVLIVAFHYGEIFPLAVKNNIGHLPLLMSVGRMRMAGAIGVPIFFVVSGFVIGLQSDRGFLDFAQKRFVRIVPLYWLLTIAVALFVSHSSFNLLLKSLAFGAYSPTQFPVIGPGWTLEYEAFFYVSFALIVSSRLFGSGVSGIAVLICLLVICIPLRLIGTPFFWKIGNPLILEFCGGLIISKIYSIPWISRLWPIYLASAAAVIAMSISPSLSAATCIGPLWGIGAFGLVLSLVCAEYRGIVLGKSLPLRVVGNASYSIYLVHVPFSLLAFPYVFWFPRMSDHMEADFCLAILVFLGVFSGLVAHYSVERPLLFATKLVFDRSMAFSIRKFAPRSIHKDQRIPNDLPVPPCSATINSSD